MGGIKPIGSEKLEGMEKIKRIMEIARYKENIPQVVNETKSTEYAIQLADGNTYRIERERQGYIIKLAINESMSDYIEPMKSRKYYSSYSQALKRLNLLTKEINVLFENEEGTSLLGEQKKKFVLKTKKTTETPPSAEAAPPVPIEPTPAPPAVATPPPTDVTAPPTDMPVGNDIPTDIGSPTSGSEEPPTDLGMPPTDNMGMDTPPSEEMPPVEDEMTDTEEMDIEVDKKPKEKKVSDLKRIQILVGKLAQKIRSYTEEKELSPKEIKYIINSILSAIDVEVLDEDDIEQIIAKLEGTEEEGEESDMGDEEEVSFKEKETEVKPTPPEEPEMTEGYDDLNSAFQDYMGSAFASQGSKALRSEMGEEEDNYYQERRKRHFYPAVDSFEHGTFGESNVDKVLSKYFILDESEEKNYELKRERKTSELFKSNKQNIIKLSESTEQLDIALDYIRKNPRSKLIGLSNKKNLIFREGINEVKITRSGRVI